MQFCHIKNLKNNELYCMPSVYCLTAHKVEQGPALISDLPDIPPPTPLLTSSPSHIIHYHDVQTKLYGKELLFEEIGLTWEMWEPFLATGLVSVRSGLVPLKNKRYRCRRCSSEDPALYGIFPCATCGKNCVYCRNCIMMGRISACSALFRWHGPSPVYTGLPELHWKGTFSDGQRKAAAAIEKTMLNSGELLVWAVCGAGKTEILFPGLEKALVSGCRVLLATPRTDVVIELLPRLRAAFPGIVISGMHGKSEENELSTQLVIATTHQAMRFTEAFDVIIVDEVDAFPFSIDSSLMYAIHKAKKESTAVIYLTATPSEQLKQQVYAGNLQTVTISRRYHGFPLPVPRYQWCGNWKKSIKKERLPSVVLKWCKYRLKHRIPVLLFVPSVEISHKVTSIMQVLHPAIQGVHSKDDDRHYKVEQFRKHEIPILITTTILERGITIPGVETAVLGAEQDIFTERALVQIAGRSGRSKQHPDGEVVFFHYGKTKAMNNAYSHIVRMNDSP